MRKRSLNTAESGESDFVSKSRLPGWIIRALKENGVRRLSRISEMSDDQLLQLRGLGRRSLGLIRDELARAAKDGQERVPVGRQDFVDT